MVVDAPSHTAWNAGTHNHSSQLLQKPSATVPLPSAAAYGSLLSQGRRISGGLLQRRPSKFRVILQHHPVYIRGEIFEMFGALAQLRGEERGQYPGKRPAGGGVGAAGRVAHQISLCPPLQP